MIEKWYIPSGRDGHTLACLAEAWHIARGLEIWPGWDLRKTPLALLKENGEMFLAGHPRPGEGAREVFWPAGTTGPAVFHTILDQSDKKGTPGQAGASVGVTVLDGTPTVMVPLSLAGEAPEETVSMITFIWEECFRAYLIANGNTKASPSVDLYPIDNPVNNALGNLEGRLLSFIRNADGSKDPARRALEFALIRRERRGLLEDETIAYERECELLDGLPFYVSTVVLDYLGSGLHEPCPAFQRLASFDYTGVARSLCSARFSALEQVNHRGLGARRERFKYTGMGVAFLLDRINPRWKNRILDPGLTLDYLLEENLTFDGGSGDDSVIARAQFELDYVKNLEEERRWSKSMREKNQAVLQEILAGDGLRLIFDVSQLTLTMASFEDEHIQILNDELKLHVGPVSFHYGHTTLSFNGLPVVEDRRSGLLQVCLPIKRFRVEGDGSRLPIIRPARFTEGLDLNLGKVQVKAHEGTIQPVDGAIYIRITA